jgi:transcriptional regulator with GAF, ATPase, and Fis domain
VATHKSDFIVPTVDLASALLAEREVAPRAQLIANRLIELFPGSAAAIHVVDSESRAFTAKATAGDVRVAGTLDGVSGIAAKAAAHRAVAVHEGRELRREDYAHLDVRRTVTSLAYAPLIADGTVLGVMEATACCIR